MKRVFIFVLIFLFLFVFVFNNKINSQGLDDQINQIKNEINNLNQQLNNKQANFQKTKEQISSIKQRIKTIAEEIVKKETGIKQSEQTLAYQKNLLNERARSYYKNLSKSSFSLINLIVAKNLSSSLENFFYQKSVIDEDKNTIIKIVLYIKNLEEKKKSLELEKQQMLVLNKDLENLSKKLGEEINQIQAKIAQLTAKQQELIAKKFAGIYIPRSASISYSCKPDFNPKTGDFRDPGFSPRFGFFTFGVPNRVGLNQWGAYGRAKSGQNEEEILRAYYNFDNIETVDQNIKIRVDGYGEFSLEEYVKRIYEMPESWGASGFSSLKAQAIAARSYVLAYTNNGEKNICPTESCQVFKPEPKGGFWEQAVNETAGKVMKKDGQTIKAWYSSTHGGYIFSSADIGWSKTSWTKNSRDTTGEITNFSDLFNNAFDKESPIFYCNWGSRPSYNKTAWLKSDEVSDIINTILLARIDSSTAPHLYQEDAGGDVWSKEKVKEELRKRGLSPFSRIDNISLSVDFSYGKTNSVSFFGDGGNVSFDGKEFKDWFNARAPADIQIRGPLYEIIIK